ncbi:g4759 [Coccomyxa viridis]|uniref:G4759 protein n=1 Tax=Coccomyxa viridis TaxID=1274662 RepID=A0ABP1FR28_9CHLO
MLKQLPTARKLLLRWNAIEWRWHRLEVSNIQKQQDRGSRDDVAVEELFPSVAPRPCQLRYEVAARDVAVQCPHSAFPHGLSEVIAPVTLDKASDLLPVSEASFEELRAANAELRASDASLEQANSKSVAALEAADAKLKELFPGSPGKNGIDALDEDPQVSPAKTASQVALASPVVKEAMVKPGSRETPVASYQGSEGANAHSGLSGNTGPLGILGTLGKLGNTGGKGPNGDSGLLGNSRKSGPTGITGANGATALEGVQGNTGLFGSLGNTGVTSEFGAFGQSGSMGGHATTGASGMSGSTSNSGLTGTGTVCIAPPVTLNFDDINNSDPFAFVQSP